MPRSSQTWMSQQIHSKVWLCKAQRNGQIPGATSVTQQVSVFMINVKVHNSTNLKKKKKKLNTHGSFGGVAREKTFLSSFFQRILWNNGPTRPKWRSYNAQCHIWETKHSTSAQTTNYWKCDGLGLKWVSNCREQRECWRKNKTLLQNQKCQIQLTFAAPHMDKQTKFYGHMRQRFSNLATILGRTFGGWMWGFQN